MIFLQVSNRIIILFMVGIILFSCSSADKKKIELLTRENEALRTEARLKDSTINQFFAFLSDVEQNLNTIKQKEQAISKSSIAGNELKPDVRQQIDEDIQTINMLMDKNWQTITLLRKKLRDANLKVAEFERMLATITQKMEEKEQEIAMLRDNLALLNITVTQLNSRIDTLTEEKVELNVKLQNQNQQLNTAWYAIGTTKELFENRVIDKTGGFLGIGKTTKMKADFNQHYFERIDITKIKSIPISGKKIRIITTHPVDSYNLLANDEGFVTELRINDYQKFWSVSKYLVIVTE